VAGETGAGRRSPPALSSVTFSGSPQAPPHHACLPVSPLPRRSRRCAAGRPLGCRAVPAARRRARGRGRSVRHGRPGGRPAATGTAPGSAARRLRMWEGGTGRLWLDVRAVVPAGGGGVGRTAPPLPPAAPRTRQHARLRGVQHIGQREDGQREQRRGAVEGGHSQVKVAAAAARCRAGRSLRGAGGSGSQTASAGCGCALRL
jgi:hypothetical protein